jgi:hypothetical protein
VPEKPKPPVPAEVDLKDFPFTPLYRARLFGSSFHARANDAEWRAGVTLWLKSQDQVPSGSLPNDDIDLCRLAELGRDMKTWRKVKDMALRGWFECDDGRLYHNVVAEVVKEQWKRKCDQRARTEAARAARAAKRLSQSLSQTKNPSVTDPVIDPATDSVTDSATEIVTASKGQGQGQGQGYNIKSYLPESPREPLRARGAPPARSRYAFSGKIIHLSHDDLERWRNSFSKIPDIIAELETIDAKLSDEGYSGKWFGRVSAWLRSRHEAILASGADTNIRGPDGPPPKPEDIWPDLHEEVKH